MGDFRVKPLFIFLAVSALTACTTTEQVSRLEPGFKARMFNSVASSYMERPTFGAIEKSSAGEQILAIQMTRYGKDALGSNTVAARFAKSAVGDYLPLLAKYEEWAALAAARGDILDKEIGRAPGWQSGVNLKFDFYSSNSQTHLLVISTCAIGTCVEDTRMYLDRPAATRLAALLTSFRAGQISGGDSASLYR